MFKNKISLVMAALLILCISIYMFTFTGKNLDFVLPRRGYKIWAMILISCAIAYSSVVFQTISSNRILTPSIMGFDSFYLLIQSVLVYIYGDKTFQVLSSSSNFALSVGLMLLFSIIMYIFVFKKETKSIYILLLVGLLLGTLFRSISSFIAILLDPNEFLVVQASMFASFENIKINLLGIATVVLIGAMFLGFRYFRPLDVVNLGRENAISLGVNYNKLVRNNLMLISVMVAVSTALVGPITFLGLLVANLSYELFKSIKHSHLIFGCCLLTSVVIIGGQYLVEHLFNMSTTISIIINFVGGIYFIYILLKSNKKS
ncbi:iron chelate uptake ABC transporter family permease subunit [Myroides indicus]|uniref:Iron complex transport system permease protein n=1 Tax=Myroides indicus TaxID=1323422 RepID=A0A4R7F0X5_9FLAO|nr:iron chelate uptake ABC transporter family permease subunit [Myroides indicus]TDS62077.1 iron complex transport system permease protein [Myroides indicus]